MQNHQNQKNKSRLRLALWGLLPVILGISLVSFAAAALSGTNLVKIWGSKNDTGAVAQSFVSGINGIENDVKTKYFYLNSASGEPKVAALAYLVGDLNTGEVILAKNQDKQLPIASVSKLMTALVTSE